MFPFFQQRWAHYSMLLLVAGALNLTNLGGPSLWDIDEGNNAEAAREMLEAANLVVPTFNYQLRVDKPALLYWLQIACYRWLGVSEFSARLPSALAAIAAVLVTYELGRRMFGASTGIMAGLILATNLAFCASAHFANPDALLNLCTLLIFTIFWCGVSRGSRAWFGLAGVAVGLAVLAKGPVGLLLPGAVCFLFLAWSRKLHVLWDRRLILGGTTFLIVAAPWYVWVALETKADFLRGFILKHNVDRFLNPMEKHGGPAYYYLAALLVGFAPWSVFLGWTGWMAWGRRAKADQADGHQAVMMPASYRFLWCWIAAYLVFFTISSTKLPNYILPIYPAVALLTARWLDRWRLGQLGQIVWPMHVGLACLTLLGIALAIGFPVAGGGIVLHAVRGRYLPGLTSWGLVGCIPMVGAVLGWWCLHKDRRLGLVLSVLVSAFLTTGSLIAFGSLALDTHKAPRALVQAAETQQTDRDIRIGCYRYFQPSLVFYNRREVQTLDTKFHVEDFLGSPLPVYLFVPEAIWQNLPIKGRDSTRVLARHYDLYRSCFVLVVTNQ